MNSREISKSSSPILKGIATYMPLNTPYVLDDSWFFLLSISKFKIEVSICIFLLPIYRWILQTIDEISFFLLMCMYVCVWIYFLDFISSWFFHDFNFYVNNERFPIEKPSFALLITTQFVVRDVLRYLENLLFPTTCLMECKREKYPVNLLYGLNYSKVHICSFNLITINLIQVMCWFQQRVERC